MRKKNKLNGHGVVWSTRVTLAIIDFCTWSEIQIETKPKIFSIKIWPQKWKLVEKVKGRRWNSCILTRWSSCPWPIGNCFCHPTLQPPVLVYKSRCSAWLLSEVVCVGFHFGAYPRSIWRFYPLSLHSPFNQLACCEFMRYISFLLNHSNDL